MINVKTWSGSASARITDMTNAGKRGKVCQVLRFSGAPWAHGVGDEQGQKAKHATLQIMAAIDRMSPGNEFADVVAVVTALVEKYQADGVPTGYVNTYTEEIRGVDAPVEPLTHGVPGVFLAGADETGLYLVALNDINEWREITPSSQKAGQAYRLASKVWKQVKRTATLREASNVLRAAGCKLHGYCGMD